MEDRKMAKMGLSWKKMIVILPTLIIALVLLLWWWCLYSGATLLPPEYNPRYKAKWVFSLPSGFIPLKEAATSSEGILHFIMWSNHIAALDPNVPDIKTRCIYLTDIRNADFIVRYKREYYINESKYHELINTVVGNENVIRHQNDHND
jgi:hypothetical protein